MVTRTTGGKLVCLERAAQWEGRHCCCHTSLGVGGGDPGHPRRQCEVRHISKSLVPTQGTAGERKGRDPKLGLHVTEQAYT